MKQGLKKAIIAAITAVAMITVSVTVPEASHIQAATKSVNITNVPYGTLTIKKGSTYQLKAKVGSKSNLNFVWKSSNKKKVSVTQKGKLKGVKKGTATITVSVKNKSYKKAKIKVTVGTKVSQIQVIKPAMVLCMGSTATIKSQVLPATASNKTVKYVSSNEKVATVNSKGVVRGIKAGTAKVTISAADGSGKNTTVTVKVAENVNEIKVVDDFYQSVNSEILNNTELDLKIGQWSQFTILEEKIDEQVGQIIDEVSGQSNADGTVSDTVADLYQTAIDTETRNQQGIKTIQGYLNQIGQVSNLEEYVALEGKLSKEGIDGIFTTFVYNDLMTVKDYQVYFYEINTGIGYDQFYNINIKKEYTDYVKKLFYLSGETEEEASVNAEKVINFQKNIAAASMDVFNSYNMNAIYNKYTLAQIKQLFTNCDIASYLEEAGYGDVKTFIVYNPEQLKRVNKFLKTSNLDMLKEYAKLNVLLQYAPYLTTEFFDAYETFDTVSNMEEEKDSLEEFSKSMVQNVLSWDVSKLYVDRNVLPGTKEDIEKMVDSILEKYHEQINASWLSSATKKEAIKKLDKIKKNISYPDDWSDYLTKADLKGPDEGGTLADNVKVLYQELEEKERNLLGTTADGSEWDISPLEVNAFYMPSFNSITIPIGITSGVFYSAERSEAANLGSLGVIIGHEISHAFDADGSNFDENGELRNWWTTADKKKYNEILESLEAYYGTFEVLPGVFQNGETTLSENMADLSGANCAVKLVENTTSARKEFFESYANLWAGEKTEMVTQFYLLYDEHANEKVRVNAVVSLLDEFYETYGVKKTDAMYVAPKNRIKVW